MKIEAGPKLIAIAKRIRLAEQKLMPPSCRESISKFGDTLFPLPGPREPWYGPTPMLSLIEHLEKVKIELNLPRNLHFADLGSGLGNACIAAAAVFDRAIGYEVVPEVYREAVRIRDELGLEGIEYRQEDFMRTSWRDFNLIYFFKPFVEEDVFEQLAVKLLETTPGTVVISRQFMASALYAPNLFRYLAPLDTYQPPAGLGGHCFPLAAYYTFVKR